MNKILLLTAAFLAGMLVPWLLRWAFNAFQLRELEYMAGVSPPKYICCNPGKLGKRFKYLHNFVIETRL